VLPSIGQYGYYRCHSARLPLVNASCTGTVTPVRYCRGLNEILVIEKNCCADRTEKGLGTVPRFRITCHYHAPPVNYCPCALSGTGPSTGHHKSLARFLFNCYQTSYTAYSTLYLHVHKPFLTKSALCSEVKKWLFVTLCHACPLMSSRGSL